MEIVVFGDFCSQQRVGALIEERKYADVFGSVQEILAGCDYSIVNLEAPVVERTAKAIKKIGPNLRCTIGAIEALKYAGFNCVTLANNHFYDYGNTGVEDTLVTCASNAIDVVGGGRNIDEATKILYKRMKGIKVAIINVCEHEWSIASPCKGGSAPLDVVKNYYQIREAKKKADYVLMIVHGGTEHYNLPTPRMKKMYRFFIDAGADVVVNHHQHCYCGYEEYNGKYIFYGLGNFCFDLNQQNQNLWHQGFGVKLSFSERISFELLPYIQCAKNATVDFDVDKGLFEREICKLNEIIQDDNLLEVSFERLLTEKERNYLVLLEPYANRWLKALRFRKLLPSLWSQLWGRYLLAVFRCESHQDLTLKILEKKVKM